MATRTATIKLTSLVCIRQHDVAGSDEPHLFIEGVDSWSAVMKQGDVRLLKLSRLFDGSLTVTLKDQDAGCWKTIGTVVVETGEASPAVFKASGAHYELWYTVS